MTRRTLTLLTLVAAVVITGCATSEKTRIARQHDEHVYALWSLPGTSTEFLTRNCPARDGGEDWGAERDLDVPNRSDCVDVAGTRDASDSEFWKFELHRVKRLTYYWAIPLSPWYKSGDTKTIGIVGTEAQCETVRLRMDRKPKGVSGAEDMHMTKGPCEGPRYFRRALEEAGYVRQRLGPEGKPREQQPQVPVQPPVSTQPPVPTVQQQPVQPESPVVQRPAVQPDGSPLPTPGERTRTRLQKCGANPNSALIRADGSWRIPSYGNDVELREIVRCMGGRMN